jgi:hypothetical protein
MLSFAAPDLMFGMPLVDKFSFVPLEQAPYEESSRLFA